MTTASYQTVFSFVFVVLVVVVVVVVVIVVVVVVVVVVFVIVFDKDMQYVKGKNYTSKVYDITTSYIKREKTSTKNPYYGIPGKILLKTEECLFFFWYVSFIHRGKTNPGI